MFTRVKCGFFVADSWVKCGCGLISMCCLFCRGRPTA